MRLSEIALRAPTERWWNWAEKLPGVVRVPLRWKFIRFLVVGGLNTAFGYGMFALFLLMGMSYPWAVLVATMAGVLFNFKSYGVLVFGSHDYRLFFRFVAVYAVCYVVNLLPLAWAEQRGISLFLMGAVIALPMAGLAFLLNRYFVFSRIR